MSAPVWIFPPVLVAACAAAAVSVASSGAVAPVALSGAASTATVALVAGETVRRGRTIAELRRRHAGQEAQLRQYLVDQEIETVRLANDLLPVLVERLQRGEFGEEVLRDIDYGSRVSPEFAAAHEAVLRSVVAAVEAEEGLRDSAQRAFVNIARRVQAIVHQQAQDLRELEDKHGKMPEIFGDLLHLDHATALVGRLADSIAVLGGARPGRQWQQNVPLFNVLRGAMSRIIDYQRVDLHSVAEIAIVGPAVEPLIHALAELLDNATRYSPPQTRVHFTATEVQSGVAVEIEDAGVGLSDEARQRAERVLAQASAGLDLDDLGESPRLGLAVVGRLAQANNFSVSLRPSAYGGVRAVLTISQEATTATPTPGGQIARAATLPPPRPRMRPLATPPEIEEMEAAAAPAPGVNGLPQRRRRRVVGAPVSPRARSAPAERGPRSGAPTSAEPAAQPGIWLAAFQQAVSGEAPSADHGRPSSDESPGKDE